MSINSALAAGVSSLVANSSALSAISDNIANSNTVGYKQNSTEFEDLVTNSSSSTNDYNAAGVRAITTQLVSEQGSAQSTTSNTDLSISGNGLFVVSNTPNPTVTDSRSFTRAGSFTVDSAGNLQNAAGFYLQGFPLNAAGVPTIDPSDVNSLKTINVGDVGGTATPTTQVSINANLDSSQTVSAAATAAGQNPPGAGAYNPTNPAANLASGAVTPDATISVPITDSEGGQQNVTIDLLKSSTANTWYAEAVAPSGQIQYGAGSTLVDNQVATGTLVFNADGTINSAQSTLFGTGGTASLNFGASGTTPAAATPTTPAGYSWGASLGVGAQSISFNLSQSPGGVTQFNSATVTQSIDSNGTQFGNLESVAIDDNGYVTATYDNGVSKKIAQVAIATFQNPDGLESVTGDAYRVSSTSGSYNLKAAGSGGAGVIAPNSLEASTVDLSTQFSALITTQEAYSASAKIITTADQLLQTLINIKQ